MTNYRKAILYFKKFCTKFQSVSVFFRTFLQYSPAAGYGTATNFYISTFFLLMQVILHYCFYNKSIRISPSSSTDNISMSVCPNCFVSFSNKILLFSVDNVYRQYHPLSSLSILNSNFRLKKALTADILYRRNTTITEMKDEETICG